ncbi:MAG TPA: hypothetical protein VFN10_21125 [Thermoanaerobaculia bacterium]|nr:hypothetical protein [Thermoanaerobaculia bacterium]
MQTANFSENPEAPPPAEPRFPRPADYYSGPAPHRVLPQWATLGCGGLAVLVLLVIFVGAALVTRGSLSSFLDLVVGMSVGEMKGMYTADVKPQQKQALDAEIERLRGDLRAGRTSMQTLEPLLRAMRSAMADTKVDGPEVDGMITAAKKVQTKKTPPRHQP